MKLTTTCSGLLAALVSFGALAGCGTASDDAASSSSALRPMTNAEALEDFNEIASAFHSLYGAMERKQARYHFDFETMVKEYQTRIAAATTEAQYRGLFQEFVSRFEDPHVSLSSGVINDASRAFRLPFSVMPVEDTFVVYAVDPSIADQIKRGDEVVSMDGKPAMDLANSWEKYGSVANHRASMHTAAARLTSRSIYLSEGLDPTAPVTIHLRAADGTERDVQLSWKENTSAHILPPVHASIPEAGMTTWKNAVAVSEPALEIAVAELAQMGARVPFFMTPAGRASLDGVQEVKPSAAALTAVGLTQAAADGINYFAVTYNMEGKKVLLVRLPDYTPKDAAGSLNYLKALFADYQSQVDALVLDETHNPGGSVPFAESVLSLLAKNKYNDYVQEMHADRKWINALASEAQQATALDPQIGQVIYGWAHEVDDAYNSGKTLSPPIPLANLDTTSDPDPAHWTKPVMMLVDELSVSCADFVPGVFKANNMGFTFGQTTMAGGGNVEKVMTTTNAQIQLSISRGLGTVYDPTGAYPEELFIEDNGVTPKVLYSHTLADFRAGYVGYIAAFNTALKAAIAAEPPPPPAPPAPPLNPPPPPPATP